MKPQTAYRFNTVIMSPLIVLIPIAFVFSLGGLSLSWQLDWRLSELLNHHKMLVIHIAISSGVSALYYAFLYCSRRFISALISARDNSQIETTQKTKVLREEIRQHKVARSELQRLATHDQLTGARNRRHFIDTLGSEFERFKRYRNDFSLLIIDLDNFQKINDSYGHRCGDVVLQRFAESVQTTLRQSDVFVRYSGQEFAIIATNTQIDSAKRFADKLCRDVQQLVITDQDVQLHITISIGVGSPTLLTELTTQNLISTTEKALAVAKKQGRNQAVSVDL